MVIIALNLLIYLLGYMIASSMLITDKHSLKKKPRPFSTYRRTQHPTKSTPQSGYEC